MPNLLKYTHQAKSSEYRLNYFDQWQSGPSITVFKISLSGNCKHR